MGDNAPYSGSSVPPSGPRPGSEAVPPYGPPAPEAPTPPGARPVPGGVPAPRVPDRGRRWFLAGGAAVALGAAAGVGVTLLRRGSEMPTGLVLAGGVKGATYLQVGTDVAKAIESVSPRTHVEVKVTKAAVDNLRLLNSGAADLGFAAIDAAALDRGVLIRSITGIARVYDSFVQLIVPDSSPIKTVGDLEGRTVSVGASGSGSEFTSTLLLNTAGVAPKSMVNLGQAPAVKALRSGKIDAAFSVTGLPTPAIAALAKTLPIRLVPVGEYYPMLERTVPHVYTFASVPAGAYQGVPETSTVRVPNALLVREGLPAHVVTRVTEAVLSDSSRRFWEHEVSKSISRERALVLGSVEMNPAAKAWLDDH